MARPRTKALKLSLGEACDIAKQIYRDYGGEASLESLSTITNNSLTSSTFRYKVGTLKSFGLVEERDNDVRLTPIGYGIVAPTSPEEEIHAVADAFLEVPTYRQFHDRYSGKLLPDRERLPNILHRELEIEKEEADEWADSIERDLETAGLLSRRGGQQMVLNRPELPTPGRRGASPEPFPAPTETIAHEPLAPLQHLTGGQRLEVSLSEGPGIIMIPKKLNSADVALLTQLLKALGPPADSLGGKS